MTENSVSPQIKWIQVLQIIRAGSRKSAQFHAVSLVDDASMCLKTLLSQSRPFYQNRNCEKCNRNF